MQFEILKGQSLEHIAPTIDAAEKYARFIIKCAPRTLTERHEVARQFGWPLEEVKDEVFYNEYQQRRARLLFPDADIDNTLNVSEVDRAEANFTHLTGLALKEPGISYRSLADSLTQLITLAKKVDLSLTDTTSPEPTPET